MKNAENITKNSFTLSNRSSELAWSSRATPTDDESIDLVLFFLVCAILTFGLVMVYSSSFILAQERSGDGFAFVKKQLVYAALGMTGLLAVLKISLQTWKRAAIPFYCVSLFLLFLVLIPGVGVRVGGAQRWINLGVFNLQPAEVAKFAAILFIARQMDKKRDDVRRFVPGIAAPFVGPVLLMGLLLLQPDFGSTVMIAMVGFALLLLGGVKKRYLFSVVSIGATTGLFLILISPYRKLRLMTFFDPWKDPLGKGFQVLQSMLGLHNGGVLGTGLGNGKEKLFYLPEAHNDFIFAVIGEELGFVGVISLIGAYTFFIYRGLKIAFTVYEQKADLFQSLLAAGITLLLGIQGYVNMGVVLGILPTKGLTLPFVSYGGSALFVDLIMVGVLLRISKGTMKDRNHLPEGSMPVFNEA